MMRAAWLLVVLLALQFVPGVGMGEALAVNVATRQIAYDTCMADAGSHTSSFNDYICYPNSDTAPYYYETCRTAKKSPSVSGQFKTKAYANANCNGSDHGPWVWTAECPINEEWDDATKTCAPAWDPQQCLARNADLGSDADKPRPSLTLCRNVAGCEFKMDTSGPDYSVTDWGGAKLYRGVMEYTGNPGSSCTTAPTEPEAEEAVAEIPPQECRQISGQTVCVKPDGKHCYSGKTNSGRQFCWTPGEVGEKTDADALQKRNAGTTPAPVVKTPPDNTAFVQDGTPITTQTTTGSATITTTTTNYTTDSGVDAGPTDDGEPADGSDPGSSDPDSPGSVTGGTECDTPPAVDGGDPLLANIILQTWGTRCATEDANAVTSSGEIGDCSSPFTVEGPPEDANVQKLKGIRADICGRYEEGEKNGADAEAFGVEADGLEPGAGESIFGTGDASGGLSESFISYGSGTCPVAELTFSIGEQTFTPPAAFCDIGAALRALFRLIALVWAIHLLGSK